jgi:subtilisin family serine protease
MRLPFPKSDCYTCRAMGEKYLVLVEHEYMVGGQVAQASARSQPESIGTTLAARRLSLEQFGEDLFGGNAFDRAVAASSLSRVDIHRQFSTPIPNLGTVARAVKPYKILEGIGALVLDEDDIPSALLDGKVSGIEIVRNRDLDAPTPNASASLTAPDPWHRTHIGVSSGYAQTGKNVLIGVLDTGIEVSHPEFAGKVVHFNEFSGAGVSVSTVARDAGDHGTHVCGILAGKMSGIAPDASLAVAAVLTRPTPVGGLSGSTIQIATGFDWLLKTSFRPDRPGVDVINASLGVSGYVSFLERLVRTARSVYKTLLIAAIGNDGRLGPGNHGSPGNYPDVVGVGATDRSDTVAPFSDWDTAWVPPGSGTSIPKPDLSAPGVDIVSAEPKGGYQAMSGTSMAAPVVTGAAALLMERIPSLVGDPTALEAKIVACATVPVTPTPSNLGGRGRIQL